MLIKKINWHQNEYSVNCTKLQGYSIDPSRFLFVANIIVFKDNVSKEIKHT